MQRLKYCIFDVESKILSNEKPPAQVTEKCLASFLKRCFDDNEDRTFHTELLTRKPWTYRQVRDDSLRIASSLINVLNLNVADVVFGYAPTSSIYARAVYACIFAGVTFTGELPRLSTVSLIPQIQDCRAKVIITTSACLTRILAGIHECPDVQTIVLLDESSESTCINGLKQMTIEDLIASGSLDDEKVPRSVSDDARDHVVFLPYSSGSTGRAKGVKRTAHSLLAQSANGARNAMPLTVSCFESFGHISGQNSLLWSLINGYHVIMIPELTIDNWLLAISRFKVTASFIPPTMVSPLSKMTLPPDCDVSSLLFVFCAGAPLPSTVVEPFLSKFPSIIKLTNLYGLSEGGMATATPLESLDYDSIGSVAQGVKIKIVDRDTGNACSFNEVGEIWLRSDMSASGYLNRPEAEAETWTQDGWVKTGDAGYYNEDGLLYLVDRYKEMIKVHINQVAPAELQALLCLHPEVSEACVVAAAHPETGETPRAFVVPKNLDQLPCEEEIVKFVNDQVVEYRQINGGLFLVEALPKMVIGKIDRQLIKKHPEKLKYLREGVKLP